MSRPARRTGRRAAAPPLPPSVADQATTIAQHYAWAVEVHGEQRASRIMRKLGIKYSELHPDARRVRDAFISVRNGQDWQAVLETWYGPEHDRKSVARRSGPGDLVAAGAC